MPVVRRALAWALVVLLMVAPAGAGGGLLTRGAGDGNPTQVFGGATLDLNFQTGFYWTGNTASSTPPITTTRASTAYAPNSSGVYSSFSSDVPRITDLGLLVEESRTNSLRNNSGQGASAPSTLPTNWSFAWNGITATVVGTGTSLGIDYVEISFSGTTADAGGGGLWMDTITGIAAVNGQAWGLSTFAATTAGTQPLTSLRGYMYDSGSGLLATLNAGFFAAGSTLTRVGSVITTNNASVAYLRPALVFSGASGLAVSFTLRVGWPQEELGASITSPIRTTSAAVTRAADAITATAPTFAGSVSMYAAGVPTSVAGYATNQTIVSLSDGTNSHLLDLRRTGTTNLAAAQGTGGTGFTLSSVAQWSTDAAGKLAASFAAGSQAISFNGATAVTGSAATLPTVTTTLNLGKITASQYWNGYIRRVAYWPGALSSAQLQGITQ